MNILSEKYTVATTDGPNEDDIWTAAIDVEYTHYCFEYIVSSWHGNAIEFHACTKEIAERRRDTVLGLLRSSQ